MPDDSAVSPEEGEDGEEIEEDDEGDETDETEGEEESTPSQSPAELADRPDEQLVILEVSVPEFTLTRDMMAYYDGAEDDLLIPLWYLVELAELPIDVDIEAGDAQGWFGREDRPFELDLRDQTVVVGDREMELEAGIAERHHDDLYVDVDALFDWWNIEWEFDFSLMQLELDPETPFPPQQRQIRKLRQERLDGFVVDDEPRYEVVPLPYQLWSKPVHEITMQGGLPTAYQLDHDDRRRRTVPQSNRYQLRGAGDLLFMNAHWSIAGSERHPVSRTRLHFERKDPDAGLLGPAEATEVRAGDIRSPSSSLVARGDRGRGVEASSFPLSRPRAFDHTTVSGQKEPGWDVELYRNDELIDFQDDASGDHYHFEDVPLLFGTNEIRVVQYGPHGERHEDVHRYHVGPDMISPGEDHYQVAVSQHNRDMVPIGTARRDTDIDGRPRGVVEYERGIFERLAVAGRFNTLPTSDGRQRFFATMGIRNAFEHAYTAFDATVSNGLALQAAGQTRLGDFNISAESAQMFGGFTSERIPYETHPLRNRSRLRVNGVIPTGDFLRLPFSITMRNDYRSELGNRTRLSKRLSARVFGISLIHNLSLQRHPGASPFFNGSLTVRRRTRTISPIGQISYNLREGIRNYRIGMDWNILSNLNFRGDILHEIGPRHDLTIRGGINHRRETFSWEANVGLSHSGGISVGVGLTTAIGHNPESDQWEPTSRPLTSTGQVVPRVFWDKSQDGTFDEEFDEPIEDAGFIIDGSRQNEFATNDDGRAVLTNIRSNEISDVKLERASLYDPFLVPVPEGHSLVARPGTQAHVDFPVVMTGEIDGTIYRSDAGTPRPAANTTVQLLDDDGEVVDEVRTAFDGFYLFDFVEPGIYTVRPLPEEVADRGLELPDEETVEIETDGTIATGRDFELKPVDR